jgi:N-acetylglucosaminylphosphatidylinositol deacetylase
MISISELILELIIIYLILSIIILIISGKVSVWNGMNGKTIGVVIAHPDDESMFFGPTIITNINKNKLFIICLSNGNHYQKGNQRILELRKSCKELGITSVDVIDDKRLEDSPNIVWNKSVVKEYIEEFIKKHNINCIISFDDFGVSGHLNHKILFKSIIEINLNNLEIYFLESVSILRKYLSFFELPITLFLNLINFRNDYKLNIISFSQYLKLLKALHKHKTQMLWFRHLYSFFSKYMFINKLKKFK